MRNQTAHLTLLWFWPFEVARTVFAAVETSTDSKKVVAARMPIIFEALRAPHRADHRELTLMISEKTLAFGQSTRSLSDAQEVVNASLEANVRVMNRTAGGGFVSPLEWFQLGQSNLQLAARLLTWPGVALGPIQRGAHANAGRFAASRRSHPIK